MNTTDKIDAYLEKMDVELPQNIAEAKNAGGKEYDAFFNKMLKKYKVKSYKDLPKNKQKTFFDEVDKKWEAKKETD
jgi:hypothetical protein